MDRLKDFDIRSLRATFLLIILILLPACSFYKVVPLQLTRVSQTEAYTQSFEINPSEELITKYKGNVRDAKIAELDNMLIDLLGRKNWQIIKDNYGSKYIVDKFLENKVKIRGLLNNTIYLEPVKHDKVLIEGFGRFFVILDKETILLSGDTHVIPKFYKLSDFKDGRLQLESKFFVTRIPKNISSYHEAKIISHIKINNKLKEENVYALNYGENHEMFLQLREKIQGNGSRKIGHLKFDQSYAASKLVDFSGMAFVKEYDEKVTGKIEFPRIVK